MPSSIRFLQPLSLCVALSLGPATLLAQNTIHVPGDQATIQGAINAANNGDTVLVAPGTYYENINFMGKAITVTSSGGAAQTIIDGSKKGTVVTFNAGEGLNSVLSGFTVQNGASNSQGGGVDISVASPTVKNNIVQNNTAAGEGGGIGINRGSPAVLGNTVQNNSQLNGGGGGGGGISATDTGSPKIIGNLIRNNSWNSGSGGGVMLFGTDSPVVSNNLITGNITQGSTQSQGGGIWDVSQHAQISHNLIYDNVVTWTGKGSELAFGVYSLGPGPTVENNTVIATSGGTLATAIYVLSFGGFGQFWNNVVIGFSGESAFTCDELSTQQPPLVMNNDVFTPNGVGFSGTCAGMVGQSGNISGDPLFVNSASDFHLQPNSPAIDAGINSVPDLPQTDYDGKPRIMDGNNDCVSTVDIGAYELQRAASVTFSTNSISFGNQVIGTSSGAQPVTFTNSGNTCFQFSNTQITGDFSQSNTCDVAGVPGGSSCSYYVAFSPVATGQRSGALNVDGSDGASTRNLNVSLSGYGLTAQPSLTLSSASLTFAAQLVGTSSAVQTVTLTSTGNTALVLSGVSVSGPFAQTNNCPSSLAPTATCTISISFHPTAGGSQSGLLSITDNALGSPQKATLSGTGVDFSIAANPTSASVKHGQSVKFTVTVTPVGGAFSSSVVLSCSGLPAGASCAFSPSNVTPGANGATSSLTFSTAGKTPRGNYNILIVGRSGTDVQSLQILVSVN